MSLTYLPGVTTLEFDQELCTGCGMCAEVGTGLPPAVLADRDACIECGACMTNCEAGALRVHVGVGCARAVLATGPDAPDCACA